MVIIRNGEKAGISFFYPIFSRSGRREIKVIPLAPYQKAVKVFAFISVALLCFGLLLLCSEIYSDNLFNIFAASALIYGGIRLWRVRATTIIPLSSQTSVKRAPVLAGIDFAGYFASLCVMEIIFARQAPSGLSLELTVAGILFFLFATLPILNSIALILGLGSKSY